MDLIKEGLLFKPKYVKQVSDIQYGEEVTHENYNEKLNLNTNQGDYNTEVLKILLSETDQTKVYHIPYLDNIIDTEIEALKQKDEEQDKAISENAEAINKNTEAIEKIINGTTKVKKAEYADKITGVEEVKPHYYYGTWYDGTVGFFEMPDSIYAKDIEANDTEISGIYYTPRVDSIEESMLAPSVRDKLNEVSITSYNDLTDQPILNGITVKGNLTLDDIGAQPKGEYLTEIPAEYITDSELTEQLGNYLTTAKAAETYNTKEELQTLQTNVESTYTITKIGSFQGTPKTGDLLITV